MRPVRLSEACQFVLDGTHSSPVRSETGIPVLSAQNVSDGRLNYETERFTTQEEFDSFRRRLNLQVGDVLLTIVGSIGRTAVVNEVQPLVFQRSVAVLRPRVAILDSRFLFHAIQDRAFHAQLKRATNQSSQAGVYLGKLQEITVPLPSIEEQRRIAAILDKADELRGIRVRSLACIESLQESVFLEMFGDPATNPCGWKRCVVGDIVHAALDGPHVSPTYAQEGVPFLSTRNIRRGEVVWEDVKFITNEDAAQHWKKCKPERGHILYTKGGTTGLAKAVDFDREIAVWVHVAVLKTNTKLVEPLWLEAMLNTTYCYLQSQRLTHGIANRDLGLTRMVKIALYLPPLDLQRSFVQRVIRLRELRFRQLESSTKLEALSTSLRGRGFQGDL